MTEDECNRDVFSQEKFACALSYFLLLTLHASELGLFSSALDGVDLTGSINKNENSPLNLINCYQHTYRHLMETEIVQALL